MLDYERFKPFTNVDIKKIIDAGYKFYYNEMDFTASTGTCGVALCGEGIKIEFSFFVDYVGNQECYVYPRMHVECDAGGRVSIKRFFVKSDENRWIADSSNTDIQDLINYKAYYWNTFLSIDDLEILNYIAKRKTLTIEWCSRKPMFTGNQLKKLSEFIFLCKDSKILEQDYSENQVFIPRTLFNDDM